MEHFIVSARKYRPLTFHSVVGQKSITTTLKNAIKNKQLAHAYLFCGPRGVGKTTCARIFAKTINCQNITDEYEACDQCESCVAFRESRSYNIHELDAASNNSVEDIRGLIEQVRIPPQIGKYSVYIIDEVHMLSSAAFNAFLKTLEEPPKHAIFVLATTEKHKILPTILSRCQIFDFNRIRVEDSVEHLQYVAKSENIEADADGLNVIAQKADGAMRDALSLFDQIVSFAGKKITYKDVIENLNVLDYDYYFRLTDAFLENKIPEALMIFNDILNHGFDGHHFVSGLSSHFRDLLVCKDTVTLELLEVGANIRERYKEQSTNCPASFLLKALEITSHCDIYYKGSNNQRLHVELAIIKLCKITNQQPEQVAVQPQNTTTASGGSNGSQKKQQNTADTQKQTRPKTKINTFSLKKSLQNNGSTQENKNEDSADTVYDSSNQANDAFSEDDLIKHWKQYTEQNDLSPRMKSLMRAQEPKLKDNFVIELQINSKTLEDDFNKSLKSKIISYLQEALNNQKIDIHTIVSEKAKPKRPYTNTEKYQYLIEQNPELEKLREEFNLEF